MTDTIEQVLSRWTDAEEIRLRAGEIDSDTMRDILAVTQAMGHQVRDACDAKIQELEGKISGIKNELNGRINESNEEIERLQVDKAEFVDALELARQYVLGMHLNLKGAMGHSDTLVAPDLAKIDAALAKASEEG